MILPGAVDCVNESLNMLRGREECIYGSVGESGRKSAALDTGICPAGLDGRVLEMDYDVGRQRVVLDSVVCASGDN